MIFLKRQKKIIVTLVISILILIFIYLIIKFFPFYSIIIVFIGKMLLPFIIAAFISYLLHPIVDYLTTGLRINRAISVLIIFLAFFILFFIIGYLTLPILTRQLIELNDQLPHLFYIYEQFIYSIYDSTAFLPEVVHDKITEFINKLETLLDGKTTKWLDKLTNIFDFIVILTIIPVLVFYFLKDFTIIKNSLQMLLTKNNYAKAELIMSAVDDSLGKYIRGQILISTTITFITLISYHLLHLKYALVLAMFAGVMNIVPYFGPLIGLLPALLLSITISWKTTIFVIITTMVVQILEGSFLSPYIMGKSVQIHPILIILSLLVGVEIGGIIGMIVAIPVVTICKGIFEKLWYVNNQSR